MDAQSAGERSQAIVNLLKQRPYSERVAFLDGTGEDGSTISSPCRTGPAPKQSLGDIALTLSDGEAILLTYYRNNILPSMALPAMIASPVSESGSLEMEKVEWLVTAISHLCPFRVVSRWPEEKASGRKPRYPGWTFSSATTAAHGWQAAVPSTVGTREFDPAQHACQRRSSRRYRALLHCVIAILQIWHRKRSPR